MGHVIRSFRDLRVWQQSMELAERIYVTSGDFPRHEMYGLSNQIRRAALSVPSNIAEGHTREHTKEFLNHLSIAQASLAEVETQLDLAVRLGYLSAERFRDSFDQITSLKKQLFALRNALVKRK